MAYKSVHENGWGGNEDHIHAPLPGSDLWCANFGEWA